MRHLKVIVVGGGAAGLMAAGQAAEAGAEVVLIEKMPRSGRKLSITGKGRCNVTNVAEHDDFLAHFGATGPFLQEAFARYFNTELSGFLESLGVALVTERGGRVFPASGKAPDIVRALVKWVTRSGVTSLCRTRVDQLLLAHGRIEGVRCGAEEIRGDAVILATGGASYPATGSSGDGYALARAVGHKVMTPRPALVPLETAGTAAARLEGLSLRNMRVTLLVDGGKQHEAFGELTFTAFGVTGPVILTLSGEAVAALQAQRKVELLIDLKPALDAEKLDRRLQRDLEARADEPLRSLMRGLLPKPLVGVCLQAVGLPSHRRGSSVTAHDRKKLGAWLKAYRLPVTGHRPFEEAIITAGGVDTREIDPTSMASLRCAGLYIAGELLDVQADTGGYNLQAAFSTGWLAGRAAAESAM
ncbi:MAG: NAD(P)/FAD-dependent oxidoreductase [Verrucomicrobia bacterium]|nr:NAD(P)/FAD-dependent oxidoreductase [Verrucomicrobiota bacterium]